MLVVCIPLAGGKRFVHGSAEHYEARVEPDTKYAVIVGVWTAGDDFTHCRDLKVLEWVARGIPWVSVMLVDSSKCCSRFDSLFLSSGEGMSRWLHWIEITCLRNPAWHFRITGNVHHRVPRIAFCRSVRSCLERP